MLFSPLATDIVGSPERKSNEQLQKQNLISPTSFSPPLLPDPDLPSTSSAGQTFPPSATSPNSLDSGRRTHSKTGHWQKVGKNVLVKALSAEEIDFYIHATEPARKREREEEAKEAQEIG